MKKYSHSAPGGTRTGYHMWKSMQDTPPRLTATCTRSKQSKLYIHFQGKTEAQLYKLVSIDISGCFQSWRNKFIPPCSNTSMFQLIFRTQWEIDKDGSISTWFRSRSTREGERFTFSTVLKILIACMIEKNRYFQKSCYLSKILISYPHYTH